MELLEKIKEFERKKKVLIDELRENIGEYLRPVFEMHPETKCFAFTAYTPYFNDGDTCTYNVHVDYPWINDDDIYETGYTFPYSRKAGHVLTDLEKQVDRFLEIFQSIPSDFYLDIFGDHVLIKFWNDGTVVVSEYEHD